VHARRRAVRPGFPRGFAKTTISENAAIWAVLYGHRKFVPIFGADAGSAGRQHRQHQAGAAENDLLYEDFPEVCHAIRALEGKPQRCASQTYHGGALTHIEWRADTIVLPTIEGSAGQRRDHHRPRHHGRLPRA
jgi:hypothetical protein